MNNFNAIKILSSQQMRWLDAETIQREPISSLDLMERAAESIFTELMNDFGDFPKFSLFCGKGNNGGDGLVLARLLALENKSVTVYIATDVASSSQEFAINLARLRDIEKITIRKFEDRFEFNEDELCVDALFGTGIQLPLNETFIELINRINSHYKNIVSIDINSGLPNDMNVVEDVVAIQSSITYCIHSPKASLFFAETGHYCQKIKVVDIGLNISAYDQIESDIFYTTAKVLSQLPDRPRFAYKQKMGHVLIVAGSKDMAGAAFLCGKASMEVGAGLVTYASPEACILPLQASFPEAMTLSNLGEDFLAEIPDSLTNYAVLAAGPGIGTHVATQKMLHKLLQKWSKPIVLDADALNCIAKNNAFFWPKNAIITPHPGEFDRLTHVHNNTYERYLTQIKFSIKHQIIVVLKGAYTCVSLPNGKAFFNSSGTPAMAKAGSGDVLTGIIAGYLAQGLQPETAAVLGVYVHGRAGEIASSKKGLYSTNATDLINNIHLCINLKKQDFS